jgi:hypothetical protein
VLGAAPDGNDRPRDEELAALEDRFGNDTLGVRLADTLECHPHIGTRLRAFHHIVTEALAAGAEHVRLVGEPAWPSGFPELASSWSRRRGRGSTKSGPEASPRAGLDP